MPSALASNERRVRRLSLETPRAYIDRVSFLVEDALRAATLPGSERGLVVVRSLDLGAIDPGRPSQAVARLIEERWRAAASHAVDFAGQGAGQAGAVRFTSEAALLAAYVHRLAAGAGLDEWFWVQALPARIPRSAGEAAVFAVLHLVASPADIPGPAAVAEFFGELAEHRALGPVLASLNGRQARRLLDAWQPSVLRHWEDRSSGPTQSGILTAGPEVDQHQPRSTDEGELLRLLELVVRAVVSAPLREPTPSALVDRLLRESSAAPPGPPERGPEAPTAPPGEDKESRAVLPAPPGLWDSPSTRAGAESLSSPSGHASDVLPGTRGQAPAGGPALGVGVGAAAPLVELAPTLHGGLLFSLAVFRHIGFLEFLDSRPEWQEAGVLPQLLTRIARAAGAPAYDPLLGAFAKEPSHPDLAAWHREARRWTRANPRMLLNWIVRRPARVGVTRSHVDLYFNLDQADVRLRRWGLDLNPGWVPALGRVVVFHYGAGDH